MTIRRPIYGVLLAGLICAGCGPSDAPPPAAQSAAAPGSLEASISDPYNNVARRVEVRLLSEPVAGTVSPGGDGGATLIITPSVRPAEEGPNMRLVQTVTTNDFGKAKFDNIPSGKYLLSAGTLSIGMMREWVEIKPGETIQPKLQLQRIKPSQKPGT